MEELLRRLVAETLGTKGEAKLYSDHKSHFRRRVRVLDSSFFPGREKNDEAATSLANGAYAEFRNVPRYSGEPAFFHTVTKSLPARGFLYYWRTSATMDFLRREGSTALRTRLSILRNTRIHLRKGFVAHSASGKRGEERWGLPGWPRSVATMDDRDAMKVRVDLRGKRGRSALTAILEAVGYPLTRAQIACVWQNSTFRDEPTETSLELRGGPDMTPCPHPNARDHLCEADVRHRVRAFFCEKLSEVERQVLRARRYDDATVPTRSFREVAQLIGARTEETYRLVERSVFEKFRRVFADPEDWEASVRALIEVLREPASCAGGRARPSHAQNA